MDSGFAPSGAPRNDGRGLSLRRSQWLYNLLERRQRLATLAVRQQRRIARGVEQLRMCLSGEANDASYRDVGVADAIPQPVRRRHLGAFGFEHLQHVADLRLAALDPQRKLLLPQHALVEQADGLVTETGGERADAQEAPPLGAASRQ